MSRSARSEQETANTTLRLPHAWHPGCRITTTPNAKAISEPRRDSQRRSQRRACRGLRSLHAFVPCSETSAPERQGLHLEMAKTTTSTRRLSFLTALGGVTIRDYMAGARRGGPDRRPNLHQAVCPTRTKSSCYGQSPHARTYTRGACDARSTDACMLCRELILGISVFRVPYSVRVTKRAGFGSSKG